MKANEPIVPAMIDFENKPPTSPFLPATGEEIRVRNYESAPWEKRKFISHSATRGYCCESILYPGTFNHWRFARAIEYTKGPCGEPDPSVTCLGKPLSEEAQKEVSFSNTPEWIEHTPGPCPLPAGTRINIKVQGNTPKGIELPALFMVVNSSLKASIWEHTDKGRLLNIIAYRVLPR